MSKPPTCVVTFRSSLLQMNVGKICQHAGAGVTVRATASQMFSLLAYSRSQRIPTVLSSGLVLLPLVVLVLGSLS